MNNHLLKTAAAALWNKEFSLWDVDESHRHSIANRLGWLDSVDWLEEDCDELTNWANHTIEQGQFKKIILLGMGGSSLGPEVLGSLFKKRENYPELIVVDTTSPEVISRIQRVWQESLFIVSSKSGTTIETRDLCEYMFSVCAEQESAPGARFVAITDPGSELLSYADRNGFLKTFINPADIGGRYSILSYFGIVPAALLGINVQQFLNHTRGYIISTKSDDPALNSALKLGQFLGQAAINGNDHLLLDFSPSLQLLGGWIEQLVAESTGKSGKGILPIVSPTQGLAAKDDPRLLTVSVQYQNEATKRGVNADMSWCIDDPYDIGAEFFKWEFATAICAAYLQVNPFDEPNVSEAKTATNQFIGGNKTLDVVASYSDDHGCLFFGDGYEKGDCPVSLASFFQKLDHIHYLGLLTYLPSTVEINKALRQLAVLINQRYDLSVTLGVGPRYLHSTGQLHKGGREQTAFVQITSDHEFDLDIPERPYSFKQLYNAQADGDFHVLSEKPRPIMRIKLKGDRLRALQHFIDLV